MTDSKSVGSDTVWVRVPPPAPNKRRYHDGISSCFMFVGREPTLCKVRRPSADGRAASNRRRRHLTSRCPTTGTSFYYVCGTRTHTLQSSTAVRRRACRAQPPSGRHLARDVPPPARLPFCWDENPHSTQVRRASSRILLCFAMLPHSIRPRHRSSFSPRNDVSRGPLLQAGVSSATAQRAALGARRPTTGTAPVLLGREPTLYRVRRTSSRILLCSAMLPHSIRPHHRSSAQQKKKPRHAAGLNVMRCSERKLYLKFERFSARV